AAAEDQREGEERDVEREQDLEREQQGAVGPEQPPEGSLRGRGRGAVDRAQRGGDPAADALEGLLADGEVHSAASHPAKSSPSPSPRTPGHARPVSAGYHSAGSSPTASRSRSSRRTALSRPERIVSTSGAPLRSSRTTTLASGWRTRKQRLCAGRLLISASSCSVRLNPSQ